MCYDHRSFSFPPCLTILAVLGGLALPNPCPGANADYEIYVVDPPINNSAIRPLIPLPSTCRPGSQLRIMACRGEYEPCSFVVETDHVLKQVDVRVGELSCGAGVIPAGAVDVRAVEPVFRRITDFPGTLNWLLLHDPTLVQMRDEPQPGALKEDASPVAKAYTKTMYFTRDPVDTPALEPADVAERRQFWLTVHVPESAQPGTYRAEISVVPHSAASRQLTLTLEVPDFELLPPKFEYSVYYPAWLEGGSLEKDNPQGYVVLTEEQYLNDLFNMVAHGCTNPTIYDGPTSKEDGSLDFARFEKILALREKAGMPKGNLYVLGAGRINSSGKINAEQRELNVRSTRELVEWARTRGYADVYLMGADEATGAALMAQRAAWESIREGGGKIFVAHYAGFTEGIGRLLDLPIMIHPMHAALDRHSMMPAEEFMRFPKEIRDAVDLEKLLAPEYRQKRIGRVHELGHKIFTYMDPLAGYTLPLVHRRMRGMGLWKSGIDGTMTWSYSHIIGGPYTKPGPMGLNLFNFVLRGKVAPFDTLSWEAYREGHDDARYLATLQDALDKASTAQRRPQLVTETENWLAQLSVHADLDAWRREMARRILALRKP